MSYIGTSSESLSDHSL